MSCAAREGLKSFSIYDKYGIRPIFVLPGDLAMVKVLLEAGADPNYSLVEEKKSLITIASYNGSADIIKLLLKHGGDANTVDIRGYSALHIAAWHGHCETVKVLLEAGAKNDEQTLDKNTPLALAAHGTHLDCMQLLLSFGCDVNNADRDGDTPLFYAANNGMTDGVRVLLENGANPDVRDCSNASVLWVAVFKGHKDIVKQLLAANVKMEVASRGMDRHPWSDQVYHFYDSPKTPFYVAIEKQLHEITVLLIISGYNLHKEKWLLKGNIQENEKSAEFLNSLTQYMQIPLSLYAICRNYLRQYFGRELHKTVGKLCLPVSVKNYLTLKSFTEKT